MSISTVAHDPSVRFADTSPTLLGRTVLSDAQLVTGLCSTTHLPSLAWT
jgi:hypothetical protein